MKRQTLISLRTAVMAVATFCLGIAGVFASSHREAPLIANDPLADNTDVYAFRSPDDPDMVTIIANYVPFELPDGGPNYFNFGENIRYEIHVDNDVTKPGDEIIYRFTFNRSNEDPTTFFNIRLGKQNLKTTYLAEKSVDGGQNFINIVENGTVPPPNIGPRSIESEVGLNTTYDALVEQAIATTSEGEKVFCGPRDDPFFVDLGGIFDLGGVRSLDGTGADRARDGLAGFNCHSIALQVPIANLQKDGKQVSEATDILDPDFVIGVWASASRPQIRTLRSDGGPPDVSGDWIQVSRLGMPLTNEVIIPLGQKDRWNSISPQSQDEQLEHLLLFANPELALYMDDSQFGGAVPGFAPLRIQTNSLGRFDFRNGKAGLSVLSPEERAGTALAEDTFGPFLLRSDAPRTVDILPIFFTGVPNIPPYQLATGKTGGPLSAGKPFINNFLPTVGDLLRLNMAVPPTDRNSSDFSSLGLVQAAVLGLTDPRFNDNSDLEFIPNMDGFPNGRRLEDDVTRIELQAVSGVVLAAIGLWYDDFDGSTPVTQDLLDVLTFSAGPEANDLPILDRFPYMATPHSGYGTKRSTPTSLQEDNPHSGSTLGFSPKPGFFSAQSYPNPSRGGALTIPVHLSGNADVELVIYNLQGQRQATLQAGYRQRGTHNLEWTPGSDLPGGSYIAQLLLDGRAVDSMKFELLP